MTGEEMMAAVDELRERLLRRSRCALANALAIEVTARVLMEPGTLTPDILTRKLVEVADTVLELENCTRINGSLNNINRTIDSLENGRVPPSQRTRRRRRS